MSISSHLPNDDDNDDESGKKKKFVKIWRFELSKEYVSFMIMMLIGLGFLIYNPLELRQQGLQDLANTQQIIANQNRSWDYISDYINNTREQDKTQGLDIIQAFFLYFEDLERDNSKIMSAFNIPNTHFVTTNGSHLITEKSIYKLPYPINITSNFPDLKLQNISNKTLEEFK